MPTKNKLKLSKEVRRVFTGTEVGVLIEDFTSQIQLVAEDVSGLYGKFDSLEVKVDRMGENLESVKLDVEVIKMDIEFIKHEFKNKVARDEFIVLERRVALLESRR